MTPLFDRNLESTGAWERAAADRFADGEVLHRRSRDLAAIYLWGYSVEIRVKAAYFRSAGLGPNRPITPADRSLHAGFAKLLFGFPGPAGGHEIDVWAQLAVAARTTTPSPYPTSFGLEVVSQASALYAVWRETLRYTDVRPTAAEVRRARSVASWFDRNYHRLT